MEVFKTNGLVGPMSFKNAKELHVPKNLIARREDADDSCSGNANCGEGTITGYTIPHGREVCCVMRMFRRTNTDIIRLRALVVLGRICF